MYENFMNCWGWRGKARGSKNLARAKVADYGRNESAKQFKATVTPVSWISLCFQYKHRPIFAHFELGHLTGQPGRLLRVCRVAMKTCKMIETLREETSKALLTFVSMINFASICRHFRAVTCLIRSAMLWKRSKCLYLLSFLAVGYVSGDEKHQGSLRRQHTAINLSLTALNRSEFRHACFSYCRDYSLCMFCPPV